MGADQTRVCKDNQENTTFKNVRSIDDCSPRGLSLQRKANVANNTGIPNNLKNGVETLSGYSLNDVRVHYNSSKPAAVQAYAYTQGTDIHIAPGQESCLPHEAWHVTQQMSGRVSSTTSIGGVAVNDDVALEHEADVMGAKASMLHGNCYAPESRNFVSNGVRQNKMATLTVQRFPLMDDAELIDAFKGKDYSYEYKVKHKERGIEYGHFFAKYSPSNNRLVVTLPVFYEKGFDESNAAEKGRRQFFKENVEKTWSGKFRIIFQRKRPKLSTPPNKSWEHELSGTEVEVIVDEKDETNRSEAYFDLRTVDSREKSGVGWGKVQLREDSFWDNSIKDRRLPGFRTWNPTAHEAGHMLGIDDEYVRDGGDVGDYTDHYELTKKAFGKKYADTHAVARIESGAEKNSIMSKGGSVKKHHYVTFWDAMVKAIQDVYGTTPSQKAPNMHEDWKIE